MTTKVKMTVALDGNGHITPIENVDSGLACGCVCPGCGEPVIARKGDNNAHHFAHQGIDHNCKSWGPETELHLRAKAYLLSQKSIALPSCNYDPRAIQLPISKAILEKTLSPTKRIPDLQLEINHELLAVEITVTHKTPRDKLAIYRKHNISAIEFDLSEFIVDDGPFDDDFLAWALVPKRIRWLTVDLFSSLGRGVFQHERKSRRKQIQRLDRELHESEKNMRARVQAEEVKLKETINQRVYLEKVLEIERKGKAGKAVKEYEQRLAQQKEEIQLALRNESRELNRLTKDVELARQWSSELSAINEKLKEENRKLKKEKKALLAGRPLL